MAFAQQRNRLTTHFSERIPVIRRRIAVFVFSYICKGLASGRSPIQGSSTQCPKEQDPETRKTEGPGPHWPVAPNGGRCTQGPVRPTCCPLDTTHAHRCLSYCSFQGDIDFILHSVITIGTRAFDRKFECQQTSSEADSGTADQHFVPLFKKLEGPSVSQRPTTGPNSVNSEINLNSI